MNNTRPSFYLISLAVDGNVNAIEKILALYDPYRTYQNVVCVRSTTNMVMSA